MRFSSCLTLIVRLHSMLLRVSDNLADRWSLACDQDDRPVRPFPYTWNLTAVDVGMYSPVILGTEEFTLFTVLLPRAWMCVFADSLSEFENRVAGLLEDVQFPGSLSFKAFTVTKLADQRLVRFGNFLAKELESLRGLADTLSSSAGIRSIEERLNSNSVELLDGLTPVQALMRRSRGEPTGAGDARERARRVRGLRARRA